VIGCLNVASHTLDNVPPVACEALETIGAQIGSTVARLKAVEALKESEERYRLLAENVIDVTEVHVRQPLRHTSPRPQR